MDAAEASRVGGEPRRVAAEVPSHPGRITINERVLEKVAKETTATALRVDRADVSVGVSETRGGLAVSVSSPLPVPNLDDTAAIQAGIPVLERVAAIQTELRDRISHVIGREVIRVNISITGAVIARQKRVK